MQTSSRAFDLRSAAVVVAFAVIFAAGLALAPSVLNGDTSWLLTVCERLLRGERFGADIFEVNPPASAWLYLPATMAARALGTSAEAAVVAMVFVLAGLSILMSDALMRRVPALAAWRAPLALAWAAAFLLLPRDSFAQREHIALMLLSPITTAFLCRAWGVAPSWPMGLAIGVFAGCAVCVKPFLAAGPALAALAALAHAPTFRTLLNVETIAAAGVAALYLAATAMFAAPWFETVLPAVLDVYGPDWRFIGRNYLYLWAPALVCAIPALCVRGTSRLPHGVFLLAALGYVFAFWAQGKNWQYHAYPATATLAAALAASVVGLPAPRAGALARGMAGAGACLAAFVLWGASRPPTESIAEMTRILSGLGRNLRVVSVVNNHATVEPAVRAAGAVSVHRLLNMWPVEYALRAPTADPALTARREAVRQWGAATAQADVAHGRPDVIVVQRAPDDLLPLLREDPAANAALAAFRPVGRVRGVIETEVWARRAPGAPQTPFDAGASAP